VVTVNQVFARARDNASQPACCVRVVCEPRDIGGRKLTSWAEAVCPTRCHRVVEARGRRTVYDLRTGSASHVWEGWL
jgi:hypothetical protein